MKKENTPIQSLSEENAQELGLPEIIVPIKIDPDNPDKVIGVEESKDAEGFLCSFSNKEARIVDLEYFDHIMKHYNEDPAIFRLKD